MKTMNFHAVLTSLPVDRVACRVTSQAGIAQIDAPLYGKELAEVKNRLERKHRLLKHILGIKTKAQHVNTRYKASKGINQFRARKEPRAFKEYVRCGTEINRLNTELSEQRKARQFAHQLIWGAKQ